MSETVTVLGLRNWHMVVGNNHVAVVISNLLRSQGRCEDIPRVLSVFSHQHMQMVSCDLA